MRLTAPGHRWPQGLEREPPAFLSRLSGGAPAASPRRISSSTKAATAAHSAPQRLEKRRLHVPAAWRAPQGQERATLAARRRRPRAQGGSSLPLAAKGPGNRRWRTPLALREGRRRRAPVGSNPRPGAHRRPAGRCRRPPLPPLARPAWPAAAGCGAPPDRPPFGCAPARHPAGWRRGVAAAVDPGLGGEVVGGAAEGLAARAAEEGLWARPRAAGEEPGHLGRRRQSGTRRRHDAHLPHLSAVVAALAGGPMPHAAAGVVGRPSLGLEAQIQEARRDVRGRVEQGIGALVSHPHNSWLLGPRLGKCFPGPPAASLLPNPKAFQQIWTPVVEVSRLTQCLQLGQLPPPADGDVTVRELLHLAGESSHHRKHTALKVILLF